MKAKGLNIGFAEELYDDSDEPTRPADTEEIPEKRDCKSVPYFGGKELKSEGTLEMDIKVEYQGGNSGSEDGVWKEIVDKVTENPKIFQFQTKSMPKTQTKQEKQHSARNLSVARNI